MIAIIGILVALLLPAVQAARQAAMRTQSTNNVKQLSLSLHNHHDTFKRFPDNWERRLSGANSAGFVEASLHFWLLPYIEQQNLYNVGETSGSGFPHDLPQLRTAVIPGFIDPRDFTHTAGIGAGDPVNGWAISNYAQSHSVFRRPGIDWEAKGGFNKLTDGSSNVVAFAQKYGTCGSNGALWAHGNWNWPWMSLFAINANPNPPQVGPTKAACDPTRTQGFGSSGCIVGLCDGSVRNISPTISAASWIQACYPADGLNGGDDFN